MNLLRDIVNLDITGFLVLLVFLILLVFWIILVFWVLLDWKEYDSLLFPASLSKIRNLEKQKKKRNASHLDLPAPQQVTRW